MCLKTRTDLRLLFFHYKYLLYCQNSPLHCTLKAYLPYTNFSCLAHTHNHINLADYNAVFIKVT